MSASLNSTLSWTILLVEELFNVVSILFQFICSISKAIYSNNNIDIRDLWFLTEK